ncbi:MAG: hypothetical protein EA349_07705 [Halomonadaceae bacterium]|nr:MAG: hypothetical protein EA349_07705 [Halomonadaceae bacterium]
MLSLNREKLRSSHQRLWFALDAVMLILLFINLTWLLLDSLYAVNGIQDMVRQGAPDLAAFYDPIHRNFIFYDLIFVSLFLSEFALRWGHAVVKGTYQRWYFYPFIHWYDLVGCIPTSGARVLRILRVVSILYRLQKYGIIDLSKTRLFEFFNFYYEALLEELTDRIVIKVLSGTQVEVQRGSPVLHRIQQEILLPRRQQLVDWLSEKVAEGARHGYVPKHQDLRRYLEENVAEAMNQNKDLKPLRYMPVIGTWASHALDRAVGDIVAQVIHQILSDLASRNNHAFVEDLVEVFINEQEEPDSASSQQVVAAVVEVLELIKDQVRIKHWRTELDERLAQNNNSD